MADTGEAWPPHGRRPALDGLRGLAALTVVIGHTLGVRPAPVLQQTLDRTPVVALWDGSAAVVLFFVLSGFVLALPFLDAAAPRWSTFLVRRHARIYPAYLVAIALAIAGNRVLAERPVAGTSAWFDRLWSVPATTGVAVQQLLLVVRADNLATGPVIWSLMHELRLAIVFPLLMVAVLRWRPPTTILVASCLALLGSWGGFVFTDPQALAPTAMYSSAFLVGALVARCQQELRDIARRAGRAGRAVLLGAALLLYTVPSWLLPGIPTPVTEVFQVLSVATGAGIFVVAAFSSAGVERLLTSGRVAFLGRISYSLYLVHLVLILAAVHSLGDRVPALEAAAAAAVASLAVAAAMHRWVEVPGIRAGRALASTLERPRRNVEPVSVLQDT
jgi:peptidoglycan/LPS O-acetylase OafA/YrhL